MPVDWDKFNEDIDDVIENAARNTDIALASRISSVTRLKDEEVIEMFPSPGDVKKLKKLLGIVNSAEQRNTKIKNIVENAEELGGVILTLIEKLA